MANLMKTEPRARAYWQHNLRHAKAAIRSEAARQLRLLRAQEALAPLLESLRDTNILVRWEVSQALAVLTNDAEAARSDAVVARLIDMLADMPTYRRLHAAWILGELHDRRAVEPLIEALRDPNWFGRAHAAEALGHIGDWRAIAPLQRACRDQENAVCDTALEAIREIYAAIEVVSFGAGNFHAAFRSPIWHNPEASELTVPLLNLKTISLQATAYDVYLVERFLTYAVNEIGQYRLKTGVEAHIYGSVRQVHPNLRNALQYMCRRLVTHPELTASQSVRPDHTGARR